MRDTASLGNGLVLEPTLKIMTQETTQEYINQMFANLEKQEAAIQALVVNLVEQSNGRQDPKHLAVSRELAATAYELCGDSLCQLGCVHTFFLPKPMKKFVRRRLRQLETSTFLAKFHTLASENFNSKTR